MIAPTIVEALRVADEAIAHALEVTRKLSDDMTWQDRSDTDELEVLIFRMSLVKMQRDLAHLVRQAQGKESIRSRSIE